jgi:hypothetical protein
MKKLCQITPHHTTLVQCADGLLPKPSRWAAAETETETLSQWSSGVVLCTFHIFFIKQNNLGGSSYYEKVMTNHTTPHHITTCVVRFKSTFFINLIILKIHYGVLQQTPSGSPLSGVGNLCNLS